MNASTRLPSGRSALLIGSLALVLVLSGCSMLSRSVEQEEESPIHMKWDEPPRLIKMVTPVYPDSARANRIEGKVVLQIVLDEVGNVIEAEPILGQPPGIFEDASINSILQWKFTPALLDGKPIKVRMGQTIEFTLGDIPAREKLQLPPEAPPPLPPPLRIEEERETPIFMTWEEAPKLIKQVKPVYPDSALAAGIEGKVILQIVVDECGDVIQATVIRGIPPGVFDDAAKEAVRQWKFTPAKKGNRAVKIRMGHEVIFRLTPSPQPPHRSPPPPPVE